MNNEEKIVYLNLFLDINQGLFNMAKEMREKGVPAAEIRPELFTNDHASDALFSKLPSFLYKYRKFDSFTVEMLEKGYLFLAKATRLNDELECTVDLSMSERFDAVNDRIKPKVINGIIDYVSTFAASGEKDLMKNIVYDCLNEDYTINRAKFQDYCLQVQNQMPGVDVVSAVNSFANIPEWFQKEKTEERMKRVFDLIVDAREKTGLCSLSERPDNDHMWEMYASNEEGYCIEYDFGHDYQLSFRTLPVIYDDDRKNNVADVLLYLLLPEAIREMTNGKISPDRSALLRIFLTKKEEWSQEEEWRVIGDADEYACGPRITRVFVGKNAKQENKETMKELGEKNGFEVVFR